MRDAVIGYGALVWLMSGATLAAIHRSSKRSAIAHRIGVRLSVAAAWCALVGLGGLGAWASLVLYPDGAMNKVLRSASFAIAGALLVMTLALSIRRIRRQGRSDDGTAGRVGRGSALDDLFD
jgi:hypothetical protein